MSRFHGKPSCLFFGLAVALALIIPVIPARADEATGSFTSTTTFSGANSLSNASATWHINIPSSPPPYNGSFLYTNASVVDSAPAPDQFDATITASAEAPPTYYSSIQPVANDSVTIQNSSGSAQVETVKVSGPLSLTISGNNPLDSASLVLDVLLLESNGYTIDDEVTQTYNANTAENLSASLLLTLPAGSTDTLLVGYAISTTAAQGAVPEPASFLLIGAGMAIIFGIYRRRAVKGNSRS